MDSDINTTPRAFGMMSIPDESVCVVIPPEPHKGSRRVQYAAVMPNASGVVY